MDSGQYAKYPHPPVRELDFSVIGESFQIITKNWLPFALCVLVNLVILYAFSLVGSFLAIGMFGMPPTNANPQADPGAVLQEAFQDAMKRSVISVPFNTIGMSVGAPFLMSMTQMALRVLKGLPVDPGHIALGWSKALPAIVIVFFTQLAVNFGALCCIVGSFLAGGLLMLSLSFASERNLTPFEAMGESWRTMKDHLWMAGLLYFVTAFLSGLGVLACCVGIFVTFPLLYVVPAVIYRDFFFGKGQLIPSTETTPFSGDPYSQITEQPRDPE